MLGPVQHHENFEQSARPAEVLNIAASQHSFADAYNLNKPKAATDATAGTEHQTVADASGATARTGATDGRSPNAQPGLTTHAKTPATEAQEAHAPSPGRIEAPADPNKIDRQREGTQPPQPENQNRSAHHLRIQLPPQDRAASPESPNPEVAKPEATKPESTKPEATKPESTKPELTKPESTKPELTKPDTTKPGQKEAAQTKPDTPKPNPTPGYPLPNLDLVDPSAPHSIHPGQCIEGTASHYGKGDGFWGKKTASGPRLKPGVPTIAVPNYDNKHESPYKVVVYNPANGKTMDATVTDKGPAKKLGRVADVESKSFINLVGSDGLANLRICRPDI